MALVLFHRVMSSSPLLAALMGIEPVTTRRPGVVVAFVGAGGKTSGLFALARELGGFRVVVTTTTRMRDPRVESGRPIGRTIVDPCLAAAADGIDWARAFEPPPEGGAFVLASAIEEPGPKIVGIDPSRVKALREVSDLVLVEADGSCGLPIKAPAAWEPVVPDCADIVVGVIGLDCLGKPLGPALAHRHELLGRLVGCVAGEELEAEHLLRLIDSPEGLFKGAPVGARRAVLLNKADALSRDSCRSLVATLIERSAIAELVIACSLRDGSGPLEVAAHGRAKAAA